MTIVAYFVIGGIILHVKFDKRGAEVVPQKSFWFDLPLLVRVCEKTYTDHNIRGCISTI